MENGHKYRFWLKDSKWDKDTMFYQDIQYLSSFLSRIYAKYQVNHPSYLPFQIEKYLMQSSEIKDKNGKLIFEGDIVEISGYGNYLCKFPFIKLYDTSDIGKIIGNIYENPV